jgi:hypothetical protein
MPGVHEEGCGKMLELEAGERDHPANGWVWVASTVTSYYVLPELESLQNSRILLIKILKDHEPLEMNVGTLDGVEKIMEI